MPFTTYTYSISQDCPQGIINISKLQDAIRNSPIIISLDHIDTIGDSILIHFKDILSDIDRNILDGGAGNPYGSHPAGGLISSTDNTPFINPPTLTSNVKSTTYLRRYGFSPNFCDPTTWWEQAIQILNEVVGTGNGINTIFQLDHGNGSIIGEVILDLEHGKITEENFLTPPNGNIGDFNILITVNGVAKTQKECFEDTGGDYICNYEKGEITFFSAPANEDLVVASYWYIPNNVGPTYTLLPSPGYQLIIDDAECSFSSDVEMLDTMHSGAFLTNYNIWAPLPKNPTLYKTISDFYNYTYGSFPVVPVLGTNARGFPQTNITLRWDFKSYIAIKSTDAGAPAFKMATKHNRKPFSGLSAVITFYALEIPLNHALS